ncbi:hypothetical protein KVM88_05035 [Helicobacter pylori]|nr:hypothetical protein KVM88_05035 [Helicobacter pylori]
MRFRRVKKHKNKHNKEHRSMDLQQIDELEKKFEEQEEQAQDTPLKQEPSTKEVKIPKKRGRKKSLLDEDKKKSFKPPKQKSQISLVFGMNALVPLGTI